MGRINFMLLSAVMGCALMLVSTQHRARGLFVEHERAVQIGRQLEVEWNQLQLDQVALAKAMRIDEVAHQQLGMTMPAPAQTRYMSVDTTPLERD
ncbi:MAG: cell division protein FtsL [Burkholderiaceae bacterium]|jgi:cell division protein FtsL